MRGREGKVALRRAFADLLPAEVTTRGKTGFGVPLGRWFRSDLRELAHDLLPSDVAGSGPRPFGACWTSTDRAASIMATGSGVC